MDAPENMINEDYWNNDYELCNYWDKSCLPLVVEIVTTSASDATNEYPSFQTWLLYIPVIGGS